MRIVSQSKGDGLTPEQQLLLRDPEAQSRVRRLIARFERRYPRWASQADLPALGELGLAEAARTYNKKKGTPFARFGWGRVHGLMMNAITHEIQQWQIGRGMYRFLESAVDAGNPGRDAAEDQLRALQDLCDMAMAADVVDLVGRATRTSAGGEKRAVARDAYARALVALDKAVAMLPDVERKLLRMHYHEEQELKDVVVPLGLRNAAQASALHQKALKKLAARLRGEGITPEVLREFA